VVRQRTLLASVRIDAVDEPIDDVDARELEAAFERAFDAESAERRVVARQARDLATSGKPEADRGAPLTVEAVIENLSDAPDAWSLANRWNWWLGALEVAHGGYRQFQVTAIVDDATNGEADSGEE
jgi:hypothetical protein